MSDLHSLQVRESEDRTRSADSERHHYLLDIDMEVGFVSILRQRRGGPVSVSEARTGRVLGRYSILVEICGLMVLSFTLLRAAMLIWFCDSPTLSAGEYARIFLTGFRFDVLVTFASALPQLLFLTILPASGRLGRFSKVLLEIQWVVGFLFLWVVLIAEWMFFDDFRSRLNYIAFEYLVYPTEVCCNIWESYQTGKILSVVGLLGFASYLFCRHRYLPRLNDGMSTGRRWRLFGATHVIVAGLAATTSMESMQVTHDRAANECAGNGLYSFCYYAWTCRVEFEDMYLTLGAADAARRTQSAVTDASDRPFAGSFHPLDRIENTGRPQRDVNVVLILEESLGSEFVGALGDSRGLTPELDRLARQGLLFDNWYATGNRTARALEAVTTSLPPLPTESILKRDHSENVFTIADVLEKRGYERLFITGGRGVFDGVRSFMTANGFNHFVEQGDYEDPLFVNAWGVADEDMFHRAIEELDKLQQTGKPFFATLLTVSNHRPFTFPDGRIPDNTQSRENAVRYADWALGEFFRHAARRDFYRNTIFVVMGDHGARVYGSQMFPMSSYRVPVLVIDPARKSRPECCHTLASSIDIAPTIMGLLGGSYRSVFFGHDVLSRDPNKAYAIMQHNHELAILDAQNHLSVVSSQKRSWSFDYDPQSFELKQCESTDIQRCAGVSAMFQTANQLYYTDRCVPDTAGVAR